MNNYFTIELNNGNKYVIVEKININDKIYFLLYDGKMIDDSFEIFSFCLLGCP